ncbi:glycosyltransferase family 4 protein [Paraclostridium sordellii]|uniref:glycosyltransferase family 4 protein n=1 Tax=Paraclostridium sordellii TaxID=1505 RepID=UPI000C78F203|nr:glycosyltransferase family 4 protein [Paeniclostridium sordellii]AUN15257.1 capsular biosynthesis protein [Paeniclostridium sordellii]
MKKILYITTVSRTINAFLIPHIQMLRKQGHIVDCACSIDKSIDSVLISDGVKVYEIPFTRNPINPGNIKALKKLIRIQEENNYDIVHVHTPVASVYGRLLKLKFPKLNTIYTVHGFHFYRGAPIINWIIYYPIEKFMANFTDTMITMNLEDYEQSKKFNIKRTYKINGVGIDLSRYTLDNYNKNELRQRLDFSDDDFIILMIAEVNKNKNHKQMIDAIEVLKNKGIEDIKVICAGDGIILDDIKRYIKEKKLENNIKMLGFRKDINELIVSCDLGILMSYREGLPRNIMEFMACGKPVIGTNIRGIKDLINNDEIGKLVELGDYETTAQYIEYFYRRRLKGNVEKIKPYDIKNVLKDLKVIINSI